MPSRSQTSFGVRYRSSSRNVRPGLLVLDTIKSFSWSRCHRGFSRLTTECPSTIAGAATDQVLPRPGPGSTRPAAVCWPCAGRAASKRTQLRAAEAGRLSRAASPTVHRRPSPGPAASAVISHSVSAPADSHLAQHFQHRDTPYGNTPQPPECLRTSVSSWLGFEIGLPPADDLVPNPAAQQPPRQDPRFDSPDRS